MEARRPAVVRVDVEEVRGGVRLPREDALAVEEPLEIRLWPDGERQGTAVSVTMRTPGSDFELAVGFLFTEGILRSREDVARVSHCVDPRAEQRYNIVNVYLRPGREFDRARLERHFYASSSCGICGKASLDAVRALGLRPVDDAAWQLDPETLGRLPASLRHRQPLFAQTGGLHAAALFDGSGRLLVLREDVGRHNAVDKVIGERLLAGAVPLARTVLLLSGRAGFEIVQKALAAGVPAVCAVSAPSSLAVDLAREFGLLLVGFLRDGRFNIYSGGGQVARPAAEAEPVADRHG